jgi:glycine cleavage system transcriptional repressor
MEKKFIMTAFGKDRPGIAANVSQLIYENGCNLEDSTMTRLSNEFTIMLLLTGPDKDGLEDQLSMECRRLEREKGISAYIRPLEDGNGESEKDFSIHTLYVEGIDQAGIVYKISKYLADNAVNISNLRSKRTASPESGTMIYTMEIEVEIPPEISPEDVDKGLGKIGDELGVEITRDPPVA